MDETIILDIPERGIQLRPGSKIKLNRFQSEKWQVGYGWFSFGGNRPFCGWYLHSLDDASKVKPLSKDDVDDIYLIES